MNASQLKNAYENNNPEGRFFTRGNMKFAGDRMTNYGVRKTTVLDIRDTSVDCFELYRKKPVKFGLQSCSYFDCQTFKRVITLAGAK